MATIGVASSAVGYAESKSNANAQLDYQNQQSASHAEYTKRSYEQQAEYQQRVADYQQEVYQQELSYRDELIDYQDKLFAENTARANDAAMRNYSEILTRLTQEEIAGAMEIEGIRRSSKSQQASALADMYDRGVDGNLADYLIDSIAQVELADIQAINQERVW
ncbi:MAG: hypothetical protein QGF32_06425, partial [Candidatus Thalassarchaeaceae archaeon]|nr:hypothetical protein [Candidatus Thalassarchaeaceae archaeon]